MMKISNAYGLAILVLVIFLAFTTPDDSVLLAIRAFAIFIGSCFGVWCIIGLNSKTLDVGSLRNYILDGTIDTNDFSPRQLPYTPHSSQTIINFIKAGRR
jgi:hypothetical protein